MQNPFDSADRLRGLGTQLIEIHDGLRDDLDALRDGICAHARTLDPRYRCVIHFDRDYFNYDLIKKRAAK